MSNLESELCERLYEQYKDRLNWYMWKYFSRLNPEDMHDIMQETWSKLVENIAIVAVLSPPEQFKWLLTVCHNEAISFMRKKKRLINQDNETLEMLMDAKKAISLEDEVLDKIMLEELLQKLSKEERNLLYMSEFAPEKKKRNRTNAETCKIYRLKQRLRKLRKEGE